MVYDFDAPKIYYDAQGRMTNGTYTIDTKGMQKHLDGTTGKSQFLYGVDSYSAVLDGAAYANEYRLWEMVRLKYM